MADQVRFELTLKRPAHWRSGGISSGSEWEVWRDDRHVADLYQTGAGWAWALTDGSARRERWAVPGTRTEALDEIATALQEH